MMMTMMMIMMTLMTTMMMMMMMMMTPSAYLNNAKNFRSFYRPQKLQGTFWFLWSM